MPSTSFRIARHARTALTGQFAGLVSTLALIALAARHGRALSTIDAISHWVWPWRARWQPGRPARTVMTGFAIHQAASMLWAFVHAGWRARRDAGRDDATVLRDALAIAGLAALVDLRLTPARFTPGFEHHLDGVELALVYAAFGVSLACRDRAIPDHRIRSVPPRTRGSRHGSLRSAHGPAQPRATQRQERDGR